MNAIEIEEALSTLLQTPFDALEFPYAFLEAFGNKATTLKRLKSGSTNASDVGGVLQRNHIHILTTAEGQTEAAFKALQASGQNSKTKVKFLLATDGKTVEIEDLQSGDVISCDYPKLIDHFGALLALAGISSVKEIKDNPIDIKATSRLNKLYVQLLADNPSWASPERRHQLNQFLARLIFCFFAEDTDLFNGKDLFTHTLAQMTDSDGSNTAEVLSELFTAMNRDGRSGARNPPVKSWADRFPYVNGGLFEGSTECPRFSRLSRTYLLRAGELDWAAINPDIFGSMIQAVADDDERGSLGMHYTSVPNIEKVLNPLFLDDVRAHLERAGDNRRKLDNLRKRLAHIRVFDPACGSGNFLVIAFIRLREIEAQIYARMGEPLKQSNIKLTQFYGIEIKSFAAEIARLALLIAEFQCDVRYIGQADAKALMLPLHETGSIQTGNALQIDWRQVCPPALAPSEPKRDLFADTISQAEIEFSGIEIETYICGNPPYLGSTWQDKSQKADLEALFKGRTKSWKSLDYVAGWFIKAADYGLYTRADSAFVSTNSICQGQQVAILWPLIFDAGYRIPFAYTSFKWKNLASHNAGVTVAIIALSKQSGVATLFETTGDAVERREVELINGYLVKGPRVEVQKVSEPLTEVNAMNFGNKPVDGGHLLLTPTELSQLAITDEQKQRFIRRIYGSSEFIKGLERYVLWIEDEHLAEAQSIPAIAERIEGVRQMRQASKDVGANQMAARAHQMREMQIGKRYTIVIPRVSSENRQFLPVGLIDSASVIGDRNFALYDAPLWNLALIASRLHWVWIGTVCVRMRTDFSYSNTLGWNTFPVPKLTQAEKDALTRCAENILLAREVHYPASIADLYEADSMPDNLRQAHAQNDDTLERIYIGRRFKNDTERLERLFALYAKMTQKESA